MFGYGVATALLAAARMLAGRGRSAARSRLKSRVDGAPLSTAATTR